MSQVLVTGDVTSPSDLLLAPGLGLAAIAWSILAVTLALRNGPMERPSRIAQLYGYTMCLVSLITILFTVPSMVDNLFRLSQPLYTTDRFPGFEPTLASFDAYKATYERTRQSGQPGDSTRTARPTDDELRKQYTALRAARIEENGFQARRELVREFLLLVLAGGLFLGHWRWLRRRGEDPAAAV
jgi:hypothetical protein